MNPAAPVLFTCVVIGGIFAFWFYTASQFAHGHTLDISKGSLMPIYCEIASDRAADLKVTGEAYIWQDNIRISVYRKSSAMITDAKTNNTANEVITPKKSGYFWYTGGDAGIKYDYVKDLPILDGISSTNSWFCWPWFLLDYSKFEVPKGVKFQ